MLLIIISMSWKILSYLIIHVLIFISDVHCVVNMNWNYKWHTNWTLSVYYNKETEKSKYIFFVSGDLYGKFTFASDRYAVLESAGKLIIDVLFHRNMP